MSRERMYNVDDSFFDIIDTEAKAYILGLICADGYLMKNGNSTGVAIDLNYKDMCILEMIKKEMGFEGNINDTSQGMRRIKITSPKLYNRLVEMGLSLTKTYTLPSLKVHIPDRLQNHLFRGHFDGDGSFTFEKNTTNHGRYVSYRNRVTIRGTAAFLKYLKDFCPIPFNERFDKTHIIYLTDRKKVLAFREWLYQNATIYLPRKYNVIPNTECAVSSNRHVKICSN
jgi:hypothetical protein